MNYLMLRALKFYSENPTTPDPIRYKCSDLYNQLRTNLLKNIAKVYNETGYYWEQYDDETGKGLGDHPFTGWTSLYVNILYEIY